MVSSQLVLRTPQMTRCVAPPPDKGIVRKTSAGSLKKTVSFSDIVEVEAVQAHESFTTDRGSVAQTKLVAIPLKGSPDDSTFRKVPLARRNSTRRAEERKRANLARVVTNHRNVMHRCSCGSALPVAYVSDNCRSCLGCGPVLGLVRQAARSISKHSPAHAMLHGDMLYIASAPGVVDSVVRLSGAEVSVKGDTVRIEGAGVPTLSLQPGSSKDAELWALQARAAVNDLDLEEVLQLAEVAYQRRKMHAQRAPLDVSKDAGDTGASFSSSSIPDEPLLALDLKDSIDVKEGQAWHSSDNTSTPLPPGQWVRLIGCTQGVEPDRERTAEPVPAAASVPGLWALSFFTTLKPFMN